MEKEYLSYLKDKITSLEIHSKRIEEDRKHLEEINTNNNDFYKKEEYFYHIYDLRHELLLDLEYIDKLLELAYEEYKEVKGEIK